MRKVSADISAYRILKNAYSLGPVHADALVALAPHRASIGDKVHLRAIRARGSELRSAQYRYAIMRMACVAGACATSKLPCGVAERARWAGSGHSASQFLGVDLM